MSQRINSYYGRRPIEYRASVDNCIMLWNDDITYAMTPFKLLTLPLGVWPLQKYNTFSLFRSIASGISMTVMTIILFLEINFGSGDAYVKLDALMLMSCTVLCALKVLSFRLYADNMIRNFSSAVKDYLAIDNERTRTIMRRHAFMGRMICYSIIFSTYAASVIFFLLPIIADDGEDIQINVTIKNQGAELPVPITFLGDLHIPTILYFTINTMQLFMLIFIGTGNCGSDSLFLGITVHLCGQMELLKVEFFKYGMKSGNLNKDFSVLASRHSYLIEHAKFLTEVISSVLLVQVFSSCLIISLIGFQLIIALKAHDAVMIIKSITVLSSLLLQLFLYSFVGDYLKCQMEEIADSIYGCKWHSLQTKLMRNVVFVTMRSQRPVQLFAGKFLIVNLKTYMTILKSSLSYLSVLRVMMDA
ncbi:odorant receptor 2a-like isoform X1 [Monomorium pharaonis]|uniref:odorant receptor 2a-like isoform X1 n=1 Tax=Monomorium pharaonis TaxID=307658 RepID=UPI0017469247|nr:odorant receptor 2a-like isoform X1 [Monomorium pharaonis]